MPKNAPKSPKNDQRSVFVAKNAKTTNIAKTARTTKTTKIAKTTNIARITKTAKIAETTRAANTANIVNTSKNQNPRIALVCDWLTTPGGAEKVLLELHQMYPDAPIYTSQYSKKGINWFHDADVRTGWLQIFPRSLRRFLGPLRQIYFSHLDLSAYDLIISVTGAEAKSVRTRPKPQKSLSRSKNTSLSSQASPAEQSSRHLCYCHVPTQYYWQMYDKYVENPGFGVLDPIVRLAFKLLVKPLRKADYRAAQLPDQFITISSYAKEQIKQYYDRDAVIIPPSVDLVKFARNPQAFPLQESNLSTSYPHPKSELSTKKRKLSTGNTEKSTASPQEIHNNPQSNPLKSQTYPQLIHNLSTKHHKFSTSFPQETPDFSTGKTEFSTVSLQPPYYIISCRQVTWKRVDLAIAACKSLDLPLKVVGSGPEHHHLVKLAENSPNIEFIPWLDTRELAALLQNAQAYLFPSLEPFGIAAVEALAAGCPVIAYRAGGSQDFIEEGKNGLFFDQQTPESLAKAIQKSQAFTFDPDVIAKTAEKFSPHHFRHQISQLITEVISKPPRPHPYPASPSAKSSPTQPKRKESTS